MSKSIPVFDVERERKWALRRAIFVREFQKALDIPHDTLPGYRSYEALNRIRKLLGKPELTPNEIRGYADAIPHEENTP